MRLKVVRLHQLGTSTGDRHALNLFSGWDREKEGGVYCIRCYPGTEYKPRLSVCNLHLRCSRRSSRLAFDSLVEYPNF